MTDHGADIADLAGLAPRTRTNRIWARRASTALCARDPEVGDCQARTSLPSTVLTELGRFQDADAIRALARQVAGMTARTAVRKLRRIRGARARHATTHRLADPDELAMRLRAEIDRYASSRVACDDRLVGRAIRRLRASAAAAPSSTSMARPDPEHGGAATERYAAELAERLESTLAGDRASVSRVGSVVLVRGDARTVLPAIDRSRVAAVVFDPPYGTSTPSWPHRERRAAIPGDDSLALRRMVLAWAHGLPVACFGSWKGPAPAGARARLIWDKGPCAGMGDLSLPWKDSAEDIFILGPGWKGVRHEGVLRHPTPHAGAVKRRHPHEKPVGVFLELLAKAPAGLVIDPCCGSGPVLAAAQALGRPAIGIEIEARWARAALLRLSPRVEESLRS